MPRNIEVKASFDDLYALARKVADIAHEGLFEIDQDDTFFPCPSGRLKLRTFSPLKRRAGLLPQARLSGPQGDFLHPVARRVARHAA